MSHARWHYGWCAWLAVCGVSAWWLPIGAVQRPTPPTKFDPPLAAGGDPADLLPAPAVAVISARHGRSGALNSLAVSPDGRWIVSGGTDRIVRVWNAATLNEVAALEGHRGAVQVAFSPNGQTLLSTDGRMVRHWDFNGGQPRLRRSMLGQRGNPFFARETGLIDMGRTFE